VKLLCQAQALPNDSIPSTMTSLRLSVLQPPGSF
jgi:hypothetical protein